MAASSVRPNSRTHQSAKEAIANETKTSLAEMRPNLRAGTVRARHRRKDHSVPRRAGRQARPGEAAQALIGRSHHARGTAAMDGWPADTGVAVRHRSAAQRRAGCDATEPQARRLVRRHSARNRRPNARRCEGAHRRRRLRPGLRRRPHGHRRREEVRHARRRRRSRPGAHQGSARECQSRRRRGAGHIQSRRHVRDGHHARRRS